MYFCFYLKLYFKSNNLFEENKMKKILSLIIAAALCCQLFANGQQDQGNGKIGEEVVTIKFLMEGNSDMQEWMDNLKADFNAEYPNIIVEDVWLPLGEDGWGGYFNKIKTMIVSGDAPDVCRVATEGFQFIDKYKIALPLDDYIAKYPEILGDFEDIHPTLRENSKIDGKTYGFPWDWNNVVTFINTEMLNEVGLPMPGENWDKEEFLKYCEALTRERNGEKVYAFIAPSAYFMSSGLMYNFDASVLNEDMTEAACNSENAIEYIQFLKDCIYKYEYSPVPTGEDLNLMLNERIAMCFAGRWPVPTFNGADIQYDVQYIPTFKVNQPVFGMGMYPVLKSSEHPEEAFIFSAWLSKKENQIKYVSKFSIPSRISSMEQVLEEAPMPPNDNIYVESAKNLKPIQAPVQFPEISAVYTRYYRQALSLENSDVRDLMNRCASEINEILSR